MASPLLQVEDLCITFYTEDGPLPAVDHVSFTLNEGEVLGIVGESGAGKSQTARALLRLIQPPGKIIGGRVIFRGQDLLALDELQMRDVRGGQISMIFQEPTASLNPIKSIGDQISRVVRLHKGLPAEEARRLAVEMLHKVNISSPEERLDQYPYQFSGGMCQRVAIAMALACSPTLLIADEPTTALDVTVQAQIMDLLEQLRTETNMAIILISHDLRLVTDFCDKILVMYGGRAMEYGPTRQVDETPMHPYTRGLAAALPALDDEGRRLATIPGRVPNLLNLPPGCPFHPRCPEAKAVCGEMVPRLLEPAPDRKVACHLYDPAVAPKMMTEPA
ncbi:MAG: ABC transporter ATP-binding protein [Caldilineaceae bacterium]|nr:ABC transporter ATP-binding protein [Caldilineaceae bacterium]